MRACCVAAVLLLSLTGLVPVLSQDAAHPKAPIVPSDLDSSERDQLRQAADLLAHGQFDPALAILQRLQLPTTVPVFVDWTPVGRDKRADYRKAVQQALDGWNQAQGVQRFQLSAREDDARLLILFEPDVAVVSTGQPQWVCGDCAAARRTGATDGVLPLVRVSVKPPMRTDEHSPASIAHIVAQGLGAYLGLTASNDPADVMSGDVHAPATPATRPSPRDIARYKAAQNARVVLLGLARRHVTPVLPVARLVLDRVEVDAGDIWRGDVAHYRFAVKNTGDAPLEIEAQPNCGCTVASLDSLILPGRDGKIEADVHTEGFRGKVAKAIDLTTNDPDKAHLSLQMTANVLSVVQVLPSEAPLIVLEESGPTVQELTVQLHDKEPVELKNVVCNMPFATVRSEPLKSADPEVHSYKVTLEVQPEAPVGRTSIAVTALTTSRREPLISIYAICEKGILASPQSVYLGMVNAATALPVTQQVSLARRSGSFRIRKVEADDAGLQVVPETVRDGSEYRLKVSYKGGWPAGTIQHKVTVETDDPKQPTIVVPIVATVTAGPTASR